MSLEIKIVDQLGKASLTPRELVLAMPDSNEQAVRKMIRKLIEDGKIAPDINWKLTVVSSYDSYTSDEYAED